MKVNCPWEECKNNKEKLCTKEEIDISKMDEWPPSCFIPMEKVPAYNLKGIPFPACASNCAAVEYFGVGECESVCGWKFYKDGEPKKGAKIIKYRHHRDEEVSVQEHLKGKHRDHCLCWQNCKHFKPEPSKGETAKAEVEKGNCPLAQKLYEICVTYNIVIPVWECPRYEKRPLQQR